MSSAPDPPLALCVASALLSSVSCYSPACAQRLLSAPGLDLWGWLAGRTVLSAAEAQQVLRTHTERLGEHGLCVLAFWYAGRPISCRAALPAAEDSVCLRVDSIVCAKTQTGCLVGYTCTRREFFVVVRGTWTAPNRRLDLQLGAEPALARRQAGPAPRSAPQTLREGLVAAAHRFYQNEGASLKLHRGFFRAATPGCFVRLQQLLGTSPAPEHVYVVGLSLGGAMAPLLVVGLANTLGWDPGPVLTCVTLGAPKIGDRACNQMLLSEFGRGGAGRRRWLRLYRSSDWVPTLPPVLVPRPGAYQHPEPSDEHAACYQALDLDAWPWDADLRWWGAKDSPAAACIYRANHRRWGHWWCWLPAYPAWG